MRIAYLVNQYPKVSHTFIRREIDALEEHGQNVERFSIRSSGEKLPDAADRAELERTRVLLDVGPADFLLHVMGAVASKPFSFLRAGRMALTLGRRSELGVLRNFAYLLEACVLEGWLRENRCEHVHAHFGTNSATVAMLCHLLGGPKFSFTAHGPEEFDKSETIGLREKIHLAEFVIGVSAFGKSQLFRHCDSSEWEKIHVVRCGVDPSYLEKPPPPIPSVRRLVCVGRLCEQKGQLLLLEAARMLRDEGVDFELVFVGDGEMRAAVEESIRRNQLGANVRITGWANATEVQHHLTNSRGLVLPSFAEGLPVVIMEAFALGRPVISTYVAGIPELVENGVSGWLVPAGSIGDLKRAMHEALSAPVEKLTEMGRRGRERVAAMHDARTSGERLLELIHAERP